MKKEALYGSEARRKILSGVKQIAAAVRVTLGPLGRNVLISKSVYTDNYIVRSLPVHITKDGYTTARNFDVQDPFEKAGVIVVKEAAQMTVNQCGDGTSSTVVLIEAIVSEGMKMVDDGVNSIQLKREIDKAVIWVVEQIKSKSVQIGEDYEKIFNIATISANNDTEIGRMIADAFEKIGTDGMIDIEAAQSVDTTIKISDGYRFDKTFVSPLFITNKEKQICEYENPLILLYEKTIIHHTQIMNALAMAAREKRALVVICEGARDEGLAFMLTNFIQGKAECVVVESPAMYEARRLEMEDIAILVGGMYMVDTKGVAIADVEFQHFGQAKKVIVTKEETLIIGGNANPEAVEILIEELEMDLTRCKNEDEKYPIEKRIAKLKGGVAVIQVGAATPTEQKERLDRFDDAIRATKSAIAEGYVQGGGRLFQLLSVELLKSKVNGDIVLGTALAIPFKQICDNAGVNYLDILDQLSGKGDNIGYNAKTGEIEDLIEYGVIDPVKVIRCAVQNAASSATMMLTSECVIADIP